MVFFCLPCRLFFLQSVIFDLFLSKIRGTFPRSATANDIGARIALHCSPANKNTAGHGLRTATTTTTTKQLKKIVKRLLKA